ncbi:uncharacterized protein LOC108672919 [Hyalella azteca]|uniref:Uncharacterized protein LOC108672919 n=1 Tax=Hyalella azteca TaxID=294128 RepID=A0A8B7NR43_HYAAZ|nr:uncharacterized protein LOC108672919 [Hyalella azteca]XP_018016169.1 uncharacterized protein LOC108672919 [Hyalella azteca]
MSMHSMLTFWGVLVIANIPFVLLQSARDCVISVPLKSLSHEPFLMLPSVYSSASSSMMVTSSTPEWLYPQTRRGGDSNLMIVMKNRESLIANCIGLKNELVLTEASSGTLKCDNGQLELDDWEVSWEDCSCGRRSKSHIRRGSTSCGGTEFPQAKIHTIGWTLANDVFVPQISVCFDPVRETTLYTVHRIMGDSLSSKVTDSKRPDFASSSVFKSPVSELYTRSAQQQSIENRFGIPVSSARGSQFLARGHLAPDADFSLLAEQDATYYFSNVLPQWQAVNNGNWKQLEEAVRSLASSKKGRRLVVYTGALPQPLMLKDKKGVLREVLLDTNNQKIPVPAVLWKAVYDPRMKKATVVLQLNSVRRDEYQNLLISELSAAAENHCSELPWVDWNITDYSEGYTFCWRAEDFVKLLSYAPEGVDTFDLLTA